MLMMVLPINTILKYLRTIIMVLETIWEKTHD